MPFPYFLCGVHNFVLILFFPSEIKPSCTARVGLELVTPLPGSPVLGVGVSPPHLTWLLLGIVNLNRPHCFLCCRVFRLLTSGLAQELTVLMWRLFQSSHIRLCLVLGSVLLLQSHHCPQNRRPPHCNWVFFSASSQTMTWKLPTDYESLAYSLEQTLGLFLTSSYNLD